MSSLFTTFDEAEDEEIWNTAFLLGVFIKHGWTTPPFAHPGIGPLISSEGLLSDACRVVLFPGLKKIAECRKYLKQTGAFLV